MSQQAMFQQTIKKISSLARLKGRAVLCWRNLTDYHLLLIGVIKTKIRWVGEVVAFSCNPAGERAQFGSSYLQRQIFLSNNNQFTLYGGNHRNRFRHSGLAPVDLPAQAKRHNRYTRSQ